MGGFVIEIEDLNFSYDGRENIFKDLNFVLKKGERVGLTGPNGSGKTTLFYLIMGLLKPNSGTIKIFGKNRYREEDFREVRRRIGLLFQDSDDQLFCPTVEEDIAFGPLNLGKSSYEVEQIVQQICNVLDLTHLRQKVTYRLSGGEKRLVALATVLAMEPECLLLDEPTSGLDPNVRDKFINYLQKTADTYILISHDMELLKDLTDRVYILLEGKMQEVDPQRPPEMP
jgi:cobalt/nickel transport system ATP-binding protein